MTRAAISRSHPRAHAICDRCGGRYNHDRLQWQFQWAGTKLQNLRILVCQGCLDVPQEQLRTFIIPQDPVPIRNPRPELSTVLYASLREPDTTVGGHAVCLREDGSLEIEETNYAPIISLRDATLGGYDTRESGSNELEERSGPISYPVYQD